MGCKSNQFESSVIAENLNKNGLEKTNNVQDADIYILNSCTVTHKSDNEALYLLRNAKHKNPQLITVLTGCLAQIEKDKLLENDYTDIVIGNDEKLNLYEFIKNAENKFCAVSDITGLKNFHEAELANTDKTRASIKIQDGCDNRCSYCIIPFARGGNRSANMEFIINQINRFASHGFKEVILTGIHIGQWGKENGQKLIDLLHEIESKTDIVRYRLGSLNPLEIDDEMLKFLKKSTKFCPHFHLSLQSACDKTLRSMNRFYTTESYLKLIDKINDTFDLPFLGSDIITGFAGETEEDFSVTVENLKKSGLSQIHTFPYSIRTGTVGAGMENQNDDKTKQLRSDVIKALSYIKHREFINKNIGKIYEVLTEKRPDKKTGKIKGITRNYLTVYLDSDDLSITNKLINVKILKFENGKIYGEIKKDAEK